MWMTKAPKCIAPYASIDLAAQLMKDLGIRRLPVVDGQRHILGIISKNDILHSCPMDKNPFSAGGDPLDSNLRVEQIMSSRVLTVDWNRPILEAAQLMRNQKIGALPVLNNNKLVGIITESDTLDALMAVLSPGANTVTVTIALAEAASDWLEELVRSARKQGAHLKSLSHLEHAGQELAIAQIEGNKSQEFIDHLWRAGHRVLSIQKSVAA